MFSYLYATSFILVLWLVTKWMDSSFKNQKNAPYFPGPKPLPFIGNALELPLSNAHQTYAEWGKKYQSDILYASALGKKILVINKLEDADELLERRTKKYSDRPVVPFLKLCGWGFNFVFMSYGKSWRFHRKLCHQHLRAEAAHEYHPLLLQKTHGMLRRLLEDPDNFEHHNKMLSISVPMVAMYGYEVESFDDPCIRAIDEAFLLATKLLAPSGTWINVIPALAYVPPWFPGAVASRTAARIRELNKDILGIPWEFAKKSFAEGTAIKSFVLDFLKKKQESGASEEEEEAMRNIPPTLYSGASDTTISAVGTFFYLMAVHPEIQKKAQEEIDSIVESGRLPTFEDRPLLPYVEAIYREVLRFAPPLPIGIPHAVTEDDYYKGCFIPKGTTVISNIWAMTRDEKLYPEPLKFKPERFFDNDGKLDNNKRVLAYGFGRRVCVGQYFSSDTMWIVIASVLACFDIGKSKDKHGNDIEINDDFDDLGLVQHKSHFQCRFAPRSSMVEELISRARDTSLES